jgi:hypothetical protein
LQISRLLQQAFIHLFILGLRLGELAAQIEQLVFGNAEAAAANGTIVVNRCGAGGFAYSALGSRRRLDGHDRLSGKGGGQRLCFVRFRQVALRRLRRLRHVCQVSLQSGNAFQRLPKAILDDKRLPVWSRFADLLEDLLGREILVQGFPRFRLPLKLLSRLEVLVGLEKEVGGLLRKR